MDWATSCEVKSGEIVKPAVGVPGPAGDRAVDDCGPEEGEDERRNDTTSLKSATYYDLDCTSTLLL